MEKTLKEAIEKVLSAKTEMDAAKLSADALPSGRDQMSLVMMWKLREHRSTHWGPIERAIDRGLYELAMDLVNIHTSETFYAVVKRHGLELKEPGLSRFEEEAFVS